MYSFVKYRNIELIINIGLLRTKYVFGYAQFTSLPMDNNQICKKINIIEIYINIWIIQWVNVVRNLEHRQTRNLSLSKPTFAMPKIRVCLCSKIFFSKIGIFWEFSKNFRRIIILKRSSFPRDKFCVCLCSNYLFVYGR